MLKLSPWFSPDQWRLYCLCQKLWTMQSFQYQFMCWMFSWILFNRNYLHSLLIAMWNLLKPYQLLNLRVRIHCHSYPYLLQSTPLSSMCLTLQRMHWKC